MPKKMSSGSSSSANGGSEDETGRALSQLSNASPLLSSPEALLSRIDDNNKSPSPPQGSQSSGESRQRKRSKKNRNSGAAAAKQDEDSVNAAKQSKFIQKVYEMASHDNNQAALGFSEDGIALEIRNEDALAPVLSRYFKHSNPKSFIRQLNNYGFKTISSTSLGGTRHVFAHPHFRRDDASLLETITRKTAVCVKKKSKGDIIRELQQKNEDQQAHLQQMEMHHLEMFQRIISLEADNKQLRTHLETMRRSFQEASNRMETMVQGVDAGSSAHAPNSNMYGHQPGGFRRVVSNGAQPQAPPPHQMYDGMGPAYYHHPHAARPPPAGPHHRPVHPQMHPHHHNSNPHAYFQQSGASGMDNRMGSYAPMGEQSDQRDGLGLADSFHLD